MQRKAERKIRKTQRRVNQNMCEFQSSDPD
jgi:hypothetical protein